jgi:hypothetical protein
MVHVNLYVFLLIHNRGKKILWLWKMFLIKKIIIIRLQVAWMCFLEALGIRFHVLEIKTHSINLVQIYECMVFVLSIIWKEFHIIETWFAFINVFGCKVIWSPYMDWHEFYLWSSKGWDPSVLSITMASLCCVGRPPVLECNT